jgi:hypothetical protein
MHNKWIKMKTINIKTYKNLFTVLAVVICILFFQAAGATNLRGRILTNGGQYPMANIRVDLMIFNPNMRQWQDVSFAVTGADGFYYFLNFFPNQLFYVSVAGRFYPPQQNPLVILAINPEEPPYYEDIPAIIL